MAHTRLLNHVVFATHCRNPWLNKAARSRMWRYGSGVCRNKRCPLIIAGGVEDHTHLLVELHPTVSMSDFVRDFKSNTSRFIHETFPDLREFAWQASYAAFGVSTSVEPAVRRYIENQEQHHRRVSFIDEPRQMFDEHGLKFEPREFEGASAPM